MSKTIDRIRKLLSLSENGAASDNEAEVARKLAERLMDAAGITLDDVLQAGADGVDPVSTVATEKGAKVSRAWMGIAATAVSYITGAYAYANTENVLIWIGTTEQREAAIELHAWVIRQIERLATGAARNAPAESRRSYMHAYRVGVADAIASNARKLGAARAAAAPATSKALETRSRLDVAIDALKPEGLRSRRVRVHRDGMAAGRLDGSTVALRSSVGGAGQRRLGAGS